MGTFGNSTVPEIATIDWTEFWQKWRQYTDWDLEYYDGAEWVSCKSDLEITRTYPEPWLCKFTLKFTASHTADYRLTFAVNRKVKEYVSKEAEGKYSLTYEDATVIFDWTDLLAVPGLELSHGVKDQYFWFRAKKANVQEGKSLTVDPTFGYDTKGSTEYGITVNDHIANKFTLTETGTPQSITLWINESYASSHVKCAIYDDDGEDGNPGTLLTYTEEKTITSPFNNWQTFNIVNTVTLSPGNYYLTVWTDGTWTYYAETTGGNMKKNSPVYNGFPNPYGTVVEQDTRKMSIYCTYDATYDGGEFYYYYRRAK